MSATTPSRVSPVRGAGTPTDATGTSGRSVATLVVLVAAGAVAVAVGSAGLVAPDAFHAASGVLVGDDVGLLSELRGGSAVILATGLVLLAAVARARLTETALVTGALLYLSYAAGRTVGLVADGRPGSGLLVAGAVELALGIACAVTLVRRRARARAGALSTPISARQ